jgi:hypothetical protein
VVDTNALLKTLGAGADVIGQIATDKAVNARRAAPNPTFDITKGVFLEVALETGNVWYPHTLTRTPVGAVTLKSVEGISIEVTDVRRTEIEIYANGTVPKGRTLFWVV